MNSFGSVIIGKPVTEYSNPVDEEIGQIEGMIGSRARQPDATASRDHVTTLLRRGPVVLLTDQDQCRTDHVAGKVRAAWIERHHPTKPREWKVSRESSRDCALSLSWRAAPSAG